MKKEKSSQYPQYPGQQQLDPGFIAQMNPEMQQQTDQTQSHPVFFSEQPNNNMPSQTAQGETTQPKQPSSQANIEIKI